MTSLYLEHISLIVQIHCCTENGRYCAPWNHVLYYVKADVFPHQANTLLRMVRGIAFNTWHYVARELWTFRRSMTFFEASYFEKICHVHSRITFHDHYCWLTKISF